MHITAPDELQNAIIFIQDEILSYQCASSIEQVIVDNFETLGDKYFSCKVIGSVVEVTPLERRQVREASRSRSRIRENQEKIDILTYILEKLMSTV